MQNIKETDDKNVVFIPVAGPIVFIPCHLCHGFGFLRQIGAFSTPCPACQSKGVIPYRQHAQA